MILYEPLQWGSRKGVRHVEFIFGSGMVIFLISLLIAAGALVALIFRRISSRQEKRERELRQSS
jgi:hypothetical protein